MQLCRCSVFPNSAPARTRCKTRPNTLGLQTDLALSRDARQHTSTPRSRLLPGRCGAGSALPPQSRMEITRGEPSSLLRSRLGGRSEMFRTKRGIVESDSCLSSSLARSMWGADDPSAVAVHHHDRRRGISGARASHAAPGDRPSCGTHGDGFRRRAATALTFVAP